MFYKNIIYSPKIQWNIHNTETEKIYVWIVAILISVKNGTPNYETMKWISIKSTNGQDREHHIELWSAKSIYMYLL